MSVRQRQTEQKENISGVIQNQVSPFQQPINAHYAMKTLSVSTITVFAKTTTPEMDSTV